MAWHEEHGSGWRVRYYLNGELQSETGFRTPDDARERVADIEYETRQGKFHDPRKAQIPFREWVAIWTEAHDVSDTTWAKYNTHITNYLLPKFGDTPLADISRMGIKSWIKKLRRQLSDSTVADIVTLLSMILGEAVDEELLGANPCRRLRLNLTAPPPRDIATAHEIHRIVARCTPSDSVLITTAAYTGMRWGELAGLQWHNVNLTARTITIDPDKGALHEISGRLELGPPKTPASARTLHLPQFLAALLTEHTARQHHDHVFTGRNGGLLRRANFRKRIWQPAIAGHPTRGWPPIKPHLTFHGLRHTHKTWLNEDHIDRALQHQRLGHRLPGVEGIYSHITQPMINTMLTALHRRWTQSNTDNE